MSEPAVRTGAGAVPAGKVFQQHRGRPNQAASFLLIRFTSRLEQSLFAAASAATFVFGFGGTAFAASICAPSADELYKIATAADALG